ncbi:SMC family domain-containing protein [Aphelenchoides avenae]|nr:SMC family domain-containing protein [Aphelenchus avenae]
MELGAKIYAKVDNIIHEIKASIDEAQHEHERIENEFNSMKTRFDASKNLAEKKKELSKLCWLLLWTPIRDKEMEISDEQDRLQKISSLKKANDIELEAAAARMVKVEAERAQTVTIAQQLRTAYMTVCGETAAREAEKKQTEHELRLSLTNLSKKKQCIDEVQKEIALLNDQLHSVSENSQRDLASEYEQTGKQKETADQRMADFTKQYRELEGKEKELEAHVNAKNAAVQGIESEKRTVEQHLSKLLRDKQTAEETQKGRRFGADVPRILQLIQENAMRFRERPIGPIGNFVSMKEPKWTAPVEFHLRKSLGAFLCSSSDDRKTFEEMLRQSQVQHVPDIIVTKFSNRPHNTGQYEPPREYPTISRVVDVSNATVYNTLVDSEHIEGIVLFESDEGARRVMSQNPPQNAFQALTMSCCQVYPQQSGKPYRYYYNNPWHPRMLVDGPASFARNSDAEIHGLQEQLRGLEQQRQQVTERYKK